MRRTGGGQRRYSLQRRFVLVFSLMLALFLGLTGMVLDRAFRDSVEAGVAEQLRVQLYVLLGAVEVVEDRFRLSGDIREPRFAQLNSGLYGRVTSRGDELLRTASALDRAFPADAVPGDLERGQFRFETQEMAGQSYFAMHYAVRWEDREAPLVFSVYESTATFLAEVSSFRASLWGWLGGVAALLLAAQLAVLRWGLAPLRDLAAEIGEIGKGEREALKGNYPQELDAVTTGFNRLMRAERKQQARYRATLGDLAHSLKTPLAVVQSTIGEIREARASGGDREQALEAVEEQVERMNQIVRYQLQRAVRGEPGSALLSRRVDVGDVLSRIARALEKVYAEDGVRLEIDADDGLVFSGDERDLMEALGNVMDNACKYGNGRVRVVAARSPAPGHPLHITVDDDGGGIPATDRERVLGRGARLDTLPRGQGIGLAVVADIVSSYGGQIDMGDSELGGARIELVFPNSSHP